jgi:HAD superfamily hydrolase (TIGR01549 family)
MSTIKAVTFDLWDTIIADESDEPKRRAQGLKSKPETRHDMVLETLGRHAPVSSDELAVAYRVANAAFVKVWQGHGITWTARERLEVLLNGLGRQLPDEELDALAAAQARMEIDVPPDPIAGAPEAIAELASRYKLCIVSDTIVTDGLGLRELLDLHGLKQHFSGFVFSDEVGRSKPHPSMFESAREQMGVDFSEMVHIGDRDHNDIKGAQANGMRAILFTARRDVDAATTSADAICASHADLPAAVDGLAGGQGATS